MPLSARRLLSPLVVTVAPAAIPTASLFAQVSVMTQTAAQAAAAQVDVSSMIGSGPSAAVLTGITGATLGIADAVVVVLPPPPASNAPPARPPPPPLAYAVAVNVSVPFPQGLALTQANVSAAIAAVSSVAVPPVDGATPASFFSPEIQVAATLAVRGFGAVLTQQQLGAVAQTLPVVLGVQRGQVAVANANSGAATTGGGTISAANASSAAIAVAVTGLSSDAQIAQGVARALGTPGVLSSVQFAVAAAATSLPTQGQLNVTLAPPGATSTVIVTAQAGAFDPAAAGAVSLALSQALSAGARTALVAAGFPQSVAEAATVSQAQRAGMPPPPATPGAAMPPPPPLASSVSVSVTIPFAPASALSPATVARMAASTAAGLRVPSGDGYLGESPTVGIADIAVTAQLAVSAQQAPSQAELTAATAAIAEALGLQPSQIALSAGAGPPPVTVSVTVSGLGDDAGGAASVARALAAQLLASAVEGALARAGARGVAVAPKGTPTAAVEVRATVGVLAGAAAGSAASALFAAMGSPALRSALVAAGFAQPSAPTDPVTTAAASPPPPFAPRPPPPAPDAPAPGSGLSAADRLAFIMAAADDLANSIMDSLLPGESAQVLLSPSLRIAVQVDLSPSPRLTTQPLTAGEGSVVAFDPLPAAALAAVLPGSLIRTSLIAAAFDFHANALPEGATGAAQGVTRLVLAGDNKAPLEVTGLAAPITFTIPAPPPGSDDKAVCSFWCVCWTWLANALSFLPFRTRLLSSDAAHEWPHQPARTIISCGIPCCVQGRSVAQLHHRRLCGAAESCAQRPHR